MDSDARGEVACPGETREALEAEAEPALEAPPPRQSRRPTVEQARLVRGMRRRGDSWRDIETWTGLHSYAVWLILKSKSPEYAVPPLPASELPPKGPYQVVSRAVLSQLEERAAVPTTLLEELTARLARIEAILREGERGNGGNGSQGTV